MRLYEVHFFGSHGFRDSYCGEATSGAAAIAAFRPFAKGEARRAGARLEAEVAKEVAR